MNLASQRVLNYWKNQASNEAERSRRSHLTRMRAATILRQASFGSRGRRIEEAIEVLEQGWEPPEVA